MLNKEVGKFVASDNHTVTHEPNPDRTEYVVRIRFHWWPDRIRWALLLGDALTNYRAALDHAVYACAAKASGSEPPPHWRSLQFPICDSPELFDAAVRRRRLESIPMPVIRRIQELQAFDGRDHPLARLRDLNDADKHRVLQFALLAITKGQFAFSPVGIDSGTIDKPLKPHTELAWARYPEPTDNVEVDYQFAIHVGLDEIVPSSVPLHGVLKSIREKVIEGLEVLRV